MDWPAVTAIAAIVTGAATSITAVPIVWRVVCKPLLTWNKRNTRYKRLGPYGRNVLKAFHDTETVHISRSYDDADPPQIHTALDCVPGAPVACRLVVSRHYEKSLERLRELGLLEGHEPWRYDRSQRNMMPRWLTDNGKQFIRKYSTGLHMGERYIRRWFKGLDRHKYEGRFLDEVGDDARRKLPNVLKGHVWLKEYCRGAKRLGEDDLMEPSIYEYPPGSREDGVEYMVEIPLHDMDVDVNDSVFIFIPADDESNKPRYLHTDPKVAASTGYYDIQAEVVGIEESKSPVGSVLNLYGTRPFDTAVEIERQSKEV